MFSLLTSLLTSFLALTELQAYVATSSEQNIAKHIVKKMCDSSCSQVDLSIWMNTFIPSEYVVVDVKLYWELSTRAASTRSLGIDPKKPQSRQLHDKCDFTKQTQNCLK